MKNNFITKHVLGPFFVSKQNRRCQSGSILRFSSGLVAIDAPLWLTAAPPQGLDVLGPHPGVSGQSGLAQAQTQQSAHETRRRRQQQQHISCQPASTTYDV